MEYIEYSSPWLLRGERLGQTEWDAASWSNVSPITDRGRARAASDHE